MTSRQGIKFTINEFDPTFSYLGTRCGKCKTLNASRLVCSNYNSDGLFFSKIYKRSFKGIWENIILIKTPCNCPTSSHIKENEADTLFSFHKAAWDEKKLNKPSVVFVFLFRGVILDVSLISWGNWSKICESHFLARLLRGGFWFLQNLFVTSIFGISSI